MCRAVSLMFLAEVGHQGEDIHCCTVDNQGAIFMAGNVSTGQRTKHFDCRLKFVVQCVIDGSLEIKFVKTADNEADILTKNVTGEFKEKHTIDMIEEVPMSK